MPTGQMKVDNADSNLLLLGRLTRPWGLKGELGFRPENSGGLPFHRRFTEVYLEEGGRPVSVESWREDGAGRLYLRLAGVESPEEAKAYAGRPLFVPSGSLPENSPGTWYVFQLVGLVARFEDGEEAGRVIGVEPGAAGANDMLVLERPGGGELLVPFVRAHVLAVELEAGRLLLKRVEEVEP